MKISNFKGIINYDFDFSDDPEDLELLSDTIKMFNALLLKNGYRRMPKQDYIDFMEFMKKNPTAHLNEYIIV